MYGQRTIVIAMLALAAVAATPATRSAGLGLAGPQSPPAQLQWGGQAGVSTSGTPRHGAGLGPAPIKADSWVEVQSPHFLVVSNAGAASARSVAGQLELMREVFKQTYPGLQVDPALPIEVLALRDRKDMQAVEPARYLGKGKLDLAGYFQPGEERNFIVMRLDTQDEDHPYATIYHEYTHLLTSKDVLPLWLTEGIAELFQQTEISGSYASLGKPSTDNLDMLRETSLIPLTTLFAVGYDSPYYNEETKGTIFYAESWALTHYLMLSGDQQRRAQLQTYIALLQQHVDAVTAATRAFGDLGVLQTALSGYVRGEVFKYANEKLSGKVDPKIFPETPITQTQADAVRADFMAHIERFDDARALLQAVLKDDPHNLPAMETMGFIEFRQNHLDAARNWYTQAVAADSQSFFAQYSYATMTMDAGSGKLDDATAAKVTASLQAAIKLAPSFAPAYDRLAVLHAERQEDLDAAYMLELQAIQLDPTEFAYRMNAANILEQQDKLADSIRVMQQALPLAKLPAQTQYGQERIKAVEDYQQRESDYAAMRQAHDQAAASAQAANAAAADSSPPTTPPPGPPVIVRNEGPAAPTPAGPKRVVTGVIAAVRCHLAPRDPASSGTTLPTEMEMDLQSGGQIITLTSPDIFKVPFNAVNFPPPKVLNPCTGLIGMHAKVDAAGNQILAVALSR